MTIICGDCLEEMRKMEDNSINAIVTDPPYGLSFMGKGWDYAVPNSDYWKECWRISKPGSFLIAMGGTRTFHRLTCAIENAGFEIRDCISWLYGSGFPKSHNNFGLEGYGTALKPAWEPCIVAMKPLDGTFKQNAERWGQAGINIDGCRIDFQDTQDEKTAQCQRGSKTVKTLYEGGFHSLDRSDRSHIKGRWPANVIFDEFFEQVLVLKDNLPNDIISVIQEYFHDYKLPNLPKRNKYISKPDQKEQRTVLQSPLLQSCPDGKNERGSSSYEGSETSAGINCSDEKATDKNGQRESGLQGLLVREGIQIHQSPSIVTRAFGDSEENDNSGRNSRTSDYDGSVFESSIEKIGNCASSQWGEGRQQDRKLRDDGQFDPQDGAQGNSQRTSRIEIRERALKVLACDVPEKWLKYFFESGEEIRSPHCAAKMLDEQSGVLKSGRLKPYKSTCDLKSRGWGFSPDRDYTSSSNTGGASRFFYCAKASSGERNEGLERFPLKECDDWPQGIRPNAKRRAACRQNKHPTVKPLKLMEYLIKLVMPPKDGILLDPFAGSGTTILAAYKLGLKAIGIEKQPEYAEIAKERLSYFEEKQSKCM